MPVVKKLSPISWKKVNVNGGLWQEKQQINHSVTLPIEYQRLVEKGNIEALKMRWKPGDPNPPHHYWDSDIGKWIEAAAYSLAKFPDRELEKKVDDVIEWIGAGQFEDGYFNTYYTVVEPGKRWTNLYYMHELYCAGHLLEGAIAYFQATGKRKMLDIMCRYMDYINEVFGKGEGKIQGYDGHQEIELALVKLYRVTGEKKYLKLSQYFIDERGQTPCFFELESLQRGVDVEKTANRPRHLKHYLHSRGPFAEYQAHRPVRDQREPVGHAVRAMYMYCAMADLAAETGDGTLLDACRTIWDHLTEKQVYVTGAIGQSPEGERFTFDYDLPNEFMYGETCASIGLVFWAHRMLQFEGESKYADIMERALYNGVLGGVSLAGDQFLYANYLSIYPDRFKHASTAMIQQMQPFRQDWYHIACCPPNLARLVASLGQYMYSTSDEGVYVHLYNDSETTAKVGENQVVLAQTTNYPWDGAIRLTVSPESISEFIVALRYPGWCRQAEIRVNGLKTHAELDKGYFILSRRWKQGDVVELRLDMPVLRMESHPSVRSNSGKVALARGPLVYCLEEADNHRDLNDIALVDDAEITARYEQDLLNGMVALETKGRRRDLSSWHRQLYRPAKTNKTDITVKAVPYYARSNRGPGEMIVWINTEV